MPVNFTAHSKKTQQSHKKIKNKEGLHPRVKYVLLTYVHGTFAG